MNVTAKTSRGVCHTAVSSRFSSLLTAHSALFNSFAPPFPRNPHFPPSGPARTLFHWLPAKSEFLAANRIIAPLSIVAALTLGAPALHAADGTYNSQTGAWNLAGSWSGGAAANIATGADSTAFFTNDVTADSSTSLGENRIIGHIVFTDSDLTTAFNRTITGNTLTLDVGSGKPSIDVTQSSRTLTISSKISGSDGLQKKGAGVLVLSTTNDFTGTIEVTAGRLQVATNNGTLGNPANGILVSSGAQMYLTGTANNAGINTSTRAITINGIGIAPNPTDTQNTNFGALRMDAGSTVGGTVTLAGDSRIGGLAAGTGAPHVNPVNTISGQITGAYGVNFSGTAFNTNAITTFVISNTANNYTGNTTISNGAFNNAAFTSRTNLRLGASNVIPNGDGTGNVVFALSGTNNASTSALDLNGKNETINGLAVTANAVPFTARITNGATSGASASVLTIGDNNTTSSFSGIIEDNDATRTLGITKIGNGTLTLSGTNTYRGATNVDAGTLKLGANNVLPNAATSTVSIGTATLDADTRTDTAGTLDVTGAATINLGSGAALAFADSKAVNWTGGTLNIIGTLGATSLRFGNSADDLTGAQLALIRVNGSGTGTYVLDANGYLILGGGGPGPVNSFTISAISSPQTVGTPITGITITAKDASNVTATSFTGTVTFGGTGGFTGPSASFTAGVLSGVSVTPTVAGSNLTFTVDDGATHTGSTTITTIQTQYQFWASDSGLTGPAGSSTDPAKEADPDKDGRNNLQEFAFDGDPLSGANDGKVVGKVATVGGNQVLTLTLPVLTGATFSPDSGDQLSALIGGITYRIEGDETLDTFADTITEVTGGDATAIQAGLPGLSTGWTYRTFRAFRAPGTVPAVPKAFLRAQIGGVLAKPNILFIFADDLGFGDLGCHGHGVIETPHLDRLAEEGTDFHQFTVASGVCSPSRVALLTGHFPARYSIEQHFATIQHHVQSNMPDWLDPQAPTLPRQLREAGYATYHFGKWHLTSREILDAPHPTAYGYDETAVWNGPDPSVDAPEIFDLAIQVIENAGDQPFFINLWLNESHTPHQPTAAWLNYYAAKGLGERQRVYPAVVSNADLQIGRILEALEINGLADNTLVIFTSDNGPEYPLEPMGTMNHPELGMGLNTWYSLGSSGGLKGAKRSLHEGGVRVPLIVRWPGKVAAGIKDETSVINGVDWLPTLCQLAGAQLPENYQGDGEDRSEVILGKPGNRSKAIFWRWPPADVGNNWAFTAVRDDKWKLLMSKNRSRIELYDIPADRAEAVNLAATYPQVVQELQGKLDQWLAELPVTPDPACFSDQR